MNYFTIAEEIFQLMTQNSPRVSVVIPTFNRAADLQRALNSVLAQSYNDWEILVVDNNSTDGTDVIVASFNDRRISIHKVNNNGVIAVSRNKGIRGAKGEFIAFLDSDDWWVPEKLEKSVNYLEQGNDLVYHDLWIVENEEKRKFRKTVGVRNLLPPVFDDLIMHGSPIANSSVVVRTELLREIKGLSEEISLIAAEDYDCWLRIALLSDRFACIPEVLGFYWQGTTNSSNADRKSVNLVKLQELYFDPFIAKHNIEMPVWFLYQRLRSSYLLRDYRKATTYIKLMSKRKMNWNMKLKLLFIQTRIKFG
jgi:glycosyltransferase involved in cell wall biosynthesis